MKKSFSVMVAIVLIASMSVLAFAACVTDDECRHSAMQCIDAVDATCIENGNVEFWYCPDCGKYYSDEMGEHAINIDDTVIVATGEHDWGAWVTDSEWGCTTGGERIRECKNCGYINTEIIPAGEHELEYIQGIPATCTATGIKEHWHCDVCGNNYADKQCTEKLTTVEVEKLMHDMRYVAKEEATCGEDGCEEYWTCESCGDVFADEAGSEIVDVEDLIIKKTGKHVLSDEWIMTKEPTKTERGLKVKKCIYCSYSISQEVDTIDYEYTEGLSYSLNETKTGYIVEYDLFQDPIMINGTIAPHAVWKGLPVVGINSIEEEEAVCLIIPETVKNLGYESLVGFEAAHKNMPNLSTIMVVEENPYFTSEDGIVYNKDKTELWLYPAKREVYEFAVPDTVKTIKEGAFWQASITFLNLNEGLTTFEQGWSFHGLKKMNVPSTIKSIAPIDVESNPLPETVEFIGSSASDIISSDNFTWYKNGWYWGSENNPYFALVGRRYFANIEVHPQTEIIADGVGVACFADYGETFVIPDSVRIVCGKLFNGGGVDNIEIGKNAYFYDENPFSGMVRIKKFSVDPENPYYTTDDKGVLYSKDFKTLICYPGASDYTSYTINEQCEEIAMGAFAATSFNDLMLQEITIPENVVKIGDDAFEGIFFKNEGLTDVYYKGDLSGWAEIDFGTNLSNPMAYVENLYINNVLMEGDIVIPEGTEKIEGYAFYNCTRLTGITIPKSITSIGEYAFYNCTGLTAITMPNSVTYIGEYAFYNCTGAKSITISDSITNIHEYTFYNCSGLSSITIPNSVTNIDEYAFSGNNTFVKNNNLTSVAIGSGVTSIGYEAFYGCSGLTDVYYQGDLSGWSEIEFGTNEANPMYYAKNLYINGELLQGDIVIPEGTEKIGEYAFYNCSGLTSITIPDSVTSIGYRAFYNCSGLTSVTIPGSVTSIGEDAFEDCSGLTDVYYQGDLSGWLGIQFGGSSANPMYYADNLYINGELLQGDIVIPDGTEKIGAYAFYNCDGLTSVVIPDSVTSIGGSAFYGCSGLTSIVVEDGNPVYHSDGNCLIETGSKTLIVGCKSSVIPDDGSVTSIGEDAFYGCSGLTSVTIPDSVTSIGDYAFSYCYGLTSVTIGNGVTSIGYRAFYECSGLTSVTIPDSVTSIGSYAFYGCSGLTSVTIGNGVTSIGSGAFSECSGLTSVTIPDSVTSFGGWAFEDCSGLTSIVIPDSVTSIGSWAFHGCSDLTSIVVEEGNPVYHSTGNCIIETESKTLIAGCKSSVIPNDGSVTSIGSWAFDGCSGLTSVTIPDSVTSIGNGAFRRCSGLTSVVIPDSVTSIHAQAFSGCSSLTSIVIPDSVTSIGNDVFYGCNGLTSVTIPDSVTSIGDWAFTGCSGLTSITIPDSVTSIGDGAFKDCSSLTSVTIPDSVTSIGSDAFEGCSGIIEIENGVSYVDGWVIDCDSSITSVELRDGTRGIASYAFDGCSGLTSVTIPDSVTSIGSCAFSGCSDLTSITIPFVGQKADGTGETYFGYIFGASHYSYNNDYVPKSLKEVIITGGTSIGNDAFYGCSGLTSVMIGDGVTSIGYRAFSYCSGLTSVTIPDSVTSIRDYAFYNCSGLTSVTIPDSVTSIGDYTFYDCSGLRSIKIPDGVTSIGDNAFYKCSGLTSVTIPDSVTSIGRSAFSGCSGLTSVTIPDSVTSIGDWAFYYCGDLTDITFQGTMAQWQAIEKGSYWDDLTGEYAVICTDGTISKANA